MVGWLIYDAGCDWTARFVQVVEDLSANSVIDIGHDGKVWSEDASIYADKISRSRLVQQAKPGRRDAMYMCVHLVGGGMIERRNQAMTEASLTSK